MEISGMKRGLLAVLIGSICSQACAGAGDGQRTDNANDPCAQNTAQVTGAVLGAVLGGLLGNQIGKGNGRKVATVAGALGGMALGNYIGSEIDRRKCEVSKIARKNDLTVVMSDISVPADQQGRNTAERVGLSIAIEDKAGAGSVVDEAGGDTLGNAALSSQFQSGSDMLNPRAESYFREIAGQYSAPFHPDAVPQDASPDQQQQALNLRQKRVLIVGHTDDTGSSRLNADLSEQRARNVARLFAEAGVPVAQVYYQGSGETQPIADNRSDQGRARNRRVEIVDLSDETMFQKYLASRAANTSYYRVSAAPAATAASQSLPADAREAPAVATVKPSPRPAAAKVAAAAAANTAATPAVTAAAPAARSGAAGRKAEAAAPAIARAEPEYDFGGQPVSGYATAPDIGRPIASKGFSLNVIASAMADDMPMARSCSEDRPRVANPVKSLLGNRIYHVSEFMPGLYGTSWMDTVNGNIVALTGVEVLRDGATPAAKPTLLLYKAAHVGAGASAKADYRGSPDVNTYQGDKGLLYRVFVNGPIKCMDIVFPRDRPAQLSGAKLYYAVANKNMVADANLKIAK